MPASLDALPISFSASVVPPGWVSQASQPKGSVRSGARQKLPWAPGAAGHLWTTWRMGLWGQPVLPCGWELSARRLRHQQLTGSHELLAALGQEVCTLV